MYRNNKANLGLRTICITVALLGMLFFTHSQFSSAAAPTSIDVTIQAGSGDTSPLDATETFSFSVVIDLPGSDTIASTDAVTVTYAIGTATGKTLALTTIFSSSPYFYNGGVQVTEGDDGAITFTKITFKTSSTATAIDYTTATTSSPQVGLKGTIRANTIIKSITDVASVAVDVASSGDDTAVSIGETVNVDVNVDNAAEGVAVVASDAMKGDATTHTLQYKIGASGASEDLALVRGDNDTHFTGMLSAVTGSSTAGAFTFESVKLSLQNADGDATTEVKTYTVADTSILTLTDAGLTIDPSNAVTDVTSVKVKISTSGDDTTVTNGESVNVDVVVVNAAEGIAVVATSTTGAATDHTLQYKIGESGASTDLALVRGDNDTHFTSMLTVGLGTTAGTFTFESIKLSLQNAAGDAIAAEVKTYTTETTSDVVVSYTDAGLTIDPSTAVADITSVAVSIAGSGDGTDVTLSETVTVDVIVVNAAEGVAVVADDAHTLQYKIGASGASTDLVLLRGDNDTHFIGMLAVDAMTPEGVFIFESVTLSLQNGAGNALSPKKITYTEVSTPAVTLTDAGLTLDPTSGVLVLADVSAVNNTAGVGDKVTFTAWITNGTDDKPLNVTVNYKITGTKTVTGSVILTNQGLNGTSMTTDLWNGTLTIPDNATAGNLTIESIVVWLMNTDGTKTSRTITAAGAKVTNVVKIDIPAPVDPPTDNKTTSTTAATTASTSTSASSSVTVSDSPVSIFAMFILIASVSMAVGIYTLRRRQ